MFIINLIYIGSHCIFGIILIKYRLVLEKNHKYENYYLEYKFNIVL